MSDPRINDPSYESAIAIVGMSGRFPDARNLGEFWHNLCGGKESISFFTDEELVAAGVAPELLADPGYVKARAVLDDVDRFDAAFFGFNPREAEMLDPQQRLFLEVSWEALETAGYDPGRYKGAIGVFASAGMNAYFVNNLARKGALQDPVSAYNAMIGNEKDFLSTRVSYKLNLRGPSVSVQTACSSSLVAVHLAVQSLLSGESDMTLAGGVSVQVPHRVGYVSQEGMILSPDGHCRAFDADARGTVPGNGAGAVLLKRLQDAIDDGDRIRGLIRGSAVNNDGSLKVGYTAPSMEGQAHAIAEALAVGEVNPSSVTYIETHGTGTELGDPIEIGALTQVFRSHTEAKGYCALGSLKSNMGHLDTAAGVAGLIKAVLALENRKIPATLHYQRPNPQIDFASSPFYVNAELRDWIPNGGPLRAAVSSFGIGGTNAHVVLEAAPREDEPVADERPQLLLLSARSAAALDAVSAGVKAKLESHPDLCLADAAHTLQGGRAVFAHRRAIVCGSTAEAVNALGGDDTQHTWSGHQERTDRPVGFLFPGQGSQHPGMSGGLYAHEPVFRQHVDACCDKLEAHLGLDLRTLIYPNVGDEEEAGRRLAETQLTQPSVFVVEYALARLWMHWGVEPDAMIGHSIGEYVAACLADVFTVDDALALVALRGKLIQALPTGRMLAVPLAEADLAPLLGDALSLAAVNAPGVSTVSGPDAAIEALEAELEKKGIEGRPLHTSHAFHSAMMDPIVETFADEVRKVGPRAPRRRYISNVTGTWIRNEEAIDPSYYGRHLRQAVRFAAGMAELTKEPDRIFLEVGPGQSMTALGRMQPGTPTVVPTLPHARDRQPDLGHAIAAAGRLWLAGRTVEWSRLHRPGRRRMPLPTYPFERQRFWIEPGDDDLERVPAPTKRADVGDWFYVPSWHRSLARRVAAEATEATGTWLVLGDDDKLAKGVAHGLRQAGRDVLRVAAGDGFGKRDDGAYTMNPERAEDYDAVLRAVRGLDKRLAGVVHLWSVGAAGSATGAERLERVRTRGFSSLVRLAQAIGRRVDEADAALTIQVVTAGAHEVTGGEELCPEAAAVFGPCQVIPQEYPGIECRTIDIDPAAVGDAVDTLVAELAAADDGATAVALRAGHRWLHGYEPVHLPQEPVEARLTRRGVYLLTGGPDGLSYELARHLAENLGARIAFIDADGLPARGAWTGWVAEHGADDPMSRRILNVQWLESHGGEVVAHAADLGSPAAVAAAVDKTIAHFGGLNGVFHAVAFGGESVATAIQQAEPGDSAAIFRDKGHAMYALEAALDGKSVDFVSVQSSLATVLGGVGFVTYAGVNHFLDAFACAHNRRSEGARWTSVDWNNWRFSDDDGGDEGFLMSHIGKLAIQPGEGFDALRRTIASGASQVVVSTATLESRFAQAEAQAARRGADDDGAAADDSRHERPEVATEYAAPRDEREQTIAEIWQDILGIARIGIEDNFFELGGHSLLAIQLVSRLRQAFDVSLSLRSLFETPTVAGLALLVAGEQPKSEDVAEMEALLREVEGLSDDEIRQSLDEDGDPVAGGGGDA